MTRLLFATTLLCAGVASAHAAGFDCSKWDKNADGSWSAKQPVELGGPTGRIDYVPGEFYKEGQTRKHLDIAKLLNANCAKQDGTK